MLPRAQASPSTSAEDHLVMVGLFLPGELARALALSGGEAAEDLHITLCYLGPLEALGIGATLVAGALCASYASSRAPLLGQIGGVGRFATQPETAGRDILWASVDIPALSTFREGLVMLLGGAGIPYDRGHGFVPHVTLAYLEREEPSPLVRLDPRPVRFDDLTLAVGAERFAFPLGRRRAWLAAQEQRLQEPE
jgi:2'-5' RNA ligase